MLMMTPPLLRYFWFHSIYSHAASCSLRSAVCSLQSAACSLQSAVCKCHTPDYCLVRYCLQLVVTRDYFIACNLTTDQSIICQQLCNWPIGYSVSGLTEGLFTTLKSQQSVFSRLVSVIHNVVVWNRAGWDKNQTDFKRKGGLQAV